MKLKPMDAAAEITLPFRTVLEWFMVSAEAPLSIQERLDDKAQELGYDNWIDAYHEGGENGT